MPNKNIRENETTSCITLTTSDFLVSTLHLLHPFTMSLSVHESATWNSDSAQLTPLQGRERRWRQRHEVPASTKGEDWRSAISPQSEPLAVSYTSTLQGINISHLGKRKIIFKMPFLGDMLVSWGVFLKLPLTGVITLLLPIWRQLKRKNSPNKLEGEWGSKVHITGCLQPTNIIPEIHLFLTIRA